MDVHVNLMHCLCVSFSASVSVSVCCVARRTRMSSGTGDDSAAAPTPQTWVPPVAPESRTTHRRDSDSSGSGSDSDGGNLGAINAWGVESSHPPSVPGFVAVSRKRLCLCVCVCVSASASASVSVSVSVCCYLCADATTHFSLFGADSDDSIGAVWPGADTSSSSEPEDDLVRA